MRYFLATLLSILVLAPIPALAEDANAVKTASYFLLSGTTLDDPSTVSSLALYDLIVLPAEAQVYNPTFFSTIRTLNPDIIILAYVPTVSWNSIWHDPLHNTLYSLIEDHQWMRSASGAQVSIWPGTQALDLTSSWQDTLVTYTVDHILEANDYWDGVFFDEVGDSISWVGSVNLASASPSIDTAWRNAYTDLFSKTRAEIGSEKIIISNGSSNLQHAPHVNGRMYESFPTPWEAGGDWSTIMDHYFDLEDAAGYDPIIILNSDTGNTGDQSDYQKVRFGLASTLLGGGFFGFDFGTESHAQLWRYDEYDAFLGLPKSAPLRDADGVWTREFSNGKVVVNPTTEPLTIRLGGEFEKIHGTQDPDFNDGSVISRITLDPDDGALLLRPLEKILGGVFFNGSFARIFNGVGDVFRTGFFAYNEGFLGGMQVIEVDLNYDGTLEAVSADGNQVFIHNADGTLHASFYPYTAAYQDGVNISVGDLESDGSIEIVTGTENGGGAHIRVFNSDGVLINPGFFGYDEFFRGGVNVTICDLNADGWYEVIAGAGVGGGPHVRVFNKDGRVINPGFFAYDENFRGGVNVACADVNGDGIDDIVTGPGLGGDPEIRVFDKDGTMLIEPFMAYESSEKKGIEVSTADLDDDGIFEIIALTREVFTLF
jgi:hypothetical protein